MQVPNFKLSLGQVAWTIYGGFDPPISLINQLRYLRQRGVPLTEKETGVGHGHRIQYGFCHLIECGLGVTGLNQRLKPREISWLLVEHRLYLRKLYREYIEAATEKDLEAAKLKHRLGPDGLWAERTLERLYDQVRDANSEGRAAEILTLAAMKREDRAHHFLRQAIYEWTGRAMEAPEFRPGPSAK